GFESAAHIGRATIVAVPTGCAGSRNGARRNAQGQSVVLGRPARRPTTPKKWDAMPLYRQAERAGWARSVARSLGEVRIGERAPRLACFAAEIHLGGPRFHGDRSGARIFPLLRVLARRRERAACRALLVGLTVVLGKNAEAVLAASGHLARK